MKQTWYAVVAAMVVCGVTLGDAFADSLVRDYPFERQVPPPRKLIGENYVGTSITATKFSDDLLDRVVDTGYTLGLDGNVSLLPNIDLRLRETYFWAEGGDRGTDIDVTGWTSDAELVLYADLGSVLYPYISGGASLVYTEIEVIDSGIRTRDDTTRVGFGSEAGMEIRITNHLLARTSIDYLYINGERAVDITALLGVWFTDHLFTGVNAYLDLEDDDTGIGLTVNYRL